METVTGRLDTEIIGEIYRSLVLLGADHELLGSVGSWGDSLPDSEVLAGVQAWNRATLAEIKACIEHYEVSCPHRGCSPDAAPETAPTEH
jgi:hypothetical protein